MAACRSSQGAEELCSLVTKTGPMGTTRNASDFPKARLCITLLSTPAVCPILPAVGCHLSSQMFPIPLVHTEVLQLTQQRKHCAFNHPPHDGCTLFCLLWADRFNMSLGKSACVVTGERHLWQKFRSQCFGKIGLTSSQARANPRPSAVKSSTTFNHCCAVVCWYPFNLERTFCRV